MWFLLNMLSLVDMLFSKSEREKKEKRRIIKANFCSVNSKFYYKSSQLPGDVNFIDFLFSSCFPNAFEFIKSTKLAKVLSLSLEFGFQ